ncbi:hypothetical protein LPJ61_004202 [Coemansia biformis]|uniref:Uncharacterized protein n=1 Tax=Coemansia biformis TaxID=1286918 RepID=A0A9W7Y9R6_9FUNG|nr:hypothetical protein LPJ61_004202 [Coemansia biformis]
MKLLGWLAALPFAMVPTVHGAPLVKSAIMTLGVDGPIETGVYDVASVGASYVVENPGLFGPLLNAIPGAQPILNAAHLLGGRFAGSTAGGIASRAIQGFLEGETGNNLPLVGWIIRNGDEHGVHSEQAQ